ncbi:DUF1203 domain-containing protein [Roseovarius sp. Pro17]|uniref:DUF1203 domain-containing protein n=1 Tax=Roseovarius sp. Pro17 TaxID=3108175 RepID=UPI002D7781EC|nr:DUF1203 domain-containing protein [Roseovarius sp. Pro17]
MTFQVHALSPQPFADLFTLPDTQLAARRARRVIVRENPGTPCRVTLEDAEIGETVLLINFDHLPVDSPYRASHAIFVREGASQAHPAMDEVPHVLKLRLISLRVFDDADMMITADVAEGEDLHEALMHAFSDPNATYIHLHYAKPGCFAASVTRAD